MLDDGAQKETNKRSLQLDLLYQRRAELEYKKSLRSSALEIDEHQQKIPFMNEEADMKAEYNQSQVQYVPYLGTYSVRIYSTYVRRQEVP